MSVTTIKVDTALRDRISAAAREHGQTIGEYLDQIVGDARRRERLQAMANAMHANPPGLTTGPRLPRSTPSAPRYATRTAARRMQAGEVYWSVPIRCRTRTGGTAPIRPSRLPHLPRTRRHLALGVPLSMTNREWPNHVPVEIPGMAGFAMTEQLRTVSRDRFDGFIGRIDADALSAIREWLADYLGF